MSKKTRKEKREEEARILAEMEDAMQEQRRESGASAEKKPERAYDASMPERIHCRKCKTLMENGKCPTCGHTVYVPMDKNKQNKIKLIATIVLIVGFIIIFALTQATK